jgi:cob(I)alamin adenosyltransferase
MSGRIYTRQGDAGATTHPGGGRVSKTHPHVELVGSLDELNSHLGLCAAQLAALSLPALESVRETLLSTQRCLFGMTASLFREPTDDDAPPAPGAAWPEVEALEQKMDAMDAKLAPLASFILPGGRIASAEMHVARTVCRRAERALTNCLPDPVPVTWVRAQAFLNRFADYLFVAARAVNRAADEADVRLKE